MKLFRSVLSVSFLFLCMSQPAFAAGDFFCTAEGEPKWWVRYFFPNFQCGVSYNHAPSLDILSPGDRTSFYAGTRFSLQVVADDKEDGDLSHKVVWTSSLDGALTDTATLSVGEHRLSAKVSDKGGLSATDIVDITILPVAVPVNTPPVVDILAPTNNALIAEGQSVRLSASAIDQEDGDISSAIKWHSSLDGAIQSGATLSVGQHQITASVTDSAGENDVASVNLIVSEINTAPNLTINSPVGSTTLEEGTALTFAASANDQQDGDLTAQVVWTSSLDGVISSPALLSVGTHRITATVSDAGGLTASDYRNVVITEKNTAPSVSFTSPANNTSVDEGESLTIRVSANDAQDGDLSGSVALYSSIDGSIESTTGLSVGTHTLTASVTDSGGLSASDTLTLTVVAANTAPVVSITAPVANTQVDQGQSIALTAAATDAEQGNLSNSVQWTSSLDGEISSPALLSVGTHTLTATVTDEQGLVATASVRVTVNEVNTAPTLSILSPSEGTTVEEGTSILFSSEAYDEQDGDLTNQVVWSSSLDGQIANITTLSVGDHVITATVEDSQGESVQAQINVTVNEPVQVAKALTIQWERPILRDNGDPLYPEELQGYEIKLVEQVSGDTTTIDVPDGYATSFTTEPLQPGVYVITLRAYDEGGAYSTESEPVEGTVGN